MDKIEIIQKNKYYSLLMIYKLGIFDWINSYDSLRRLVKRDIKNKNKIFHVVTYGKGQGKRYLIKGNVVINIYKKTRKGFTFNNYK